MWISRQKHNNLLHEIGQLSYLVESLEKQNNELFFKLQTQIKKNEIKFDGKFWRNKGQFASPKQKELNLK